MKRIHRAIAMYLFPMMLTIFAGCVAADDESQSEPMPQETTSTDTSSLAIPEALQAITPAVTCSSTHGACVQGGVCRGQGGRQVAATGCRTGLICCVFPST